METLPDALISEILRRIDKTADKNVVSMVCSRLCGIEAQDREFLRVGCGLHPFAEALTSLFIRFPNLTRVEIVYSGWMSNMGRQLDNEGLLLLSSHCPNLLDLTLSFCSFIDDTGFGYLGCCERLRALKLDFIPGVSSNGLLWVVNGCKNLSALQLSHCMKVNSVEWLEYVGRHGNLEFLSVKNCRGIEQDDLIVLGRGWKKLKKLEFELDRNYRPRMVYSQWAINEWKKEISCESLMELSLVKCDLGLGRPLSYVMGRCCALENLTLDVCSGVEDSHLFAVSKNSSNLRRISLKLSAALVAFMDGLFALSDNGLKELARGCPKLEEIELCLSGSEIPSLSFFTQDGLLNLVKSCPVRVLVLNSPSFFSDAGMYILCTAHFLQVLELVNCQDVTDDGIRLVVNFPSLISLKVYKCLGVSDAGLNPLVGSGKLDSLVVEGCPLVSENGILGAAKYVSFKQDLSWMY